MVRRAAYFESIHIGRTPPPAPQEGHVFNLTAPHEMLFLVAKVALLVGDKVPGGAKYVVRQFKNWDEMLSYERTTQERLSLMSDWQQENTIMPIYGLLY